MSLLLKLSLVIYAVLVTIYCFQKKFRSQRWLRIFSKMLCSVGFLLVAAACGLESGFRKEPLWSWVIFFLFCKKEKPAERNLILLPWGAFPSFQPTYCSQLFLCIIEDFIGAR